MLRRTIVVPPESVYPADEWRVIESRYTDRFFGRAETALALSNGYLGVRGSFDEGRPGLYPGTFVNGFHETWDIVHAEPAHGLAQTGQTIVIAPDATPLRLFVDDEPLYLPAARLRHYERVLDMRAGTLERRLDWATPSGKHVAVSSCRLVSLEHRHLMAITFEVVVDSPAPVTICSQIVNREDLPAESEWRKDADPRLGTELPERVLNAEIAEHERERLVLGYRTTRSGMTLGVGVDHVIDSPAPYSTAVSLDHDTGEMRLTVDAQPAVPIRLTKYVAYHSSRSAPAAELARRCEWTLARGVRLGFDSLARCQRRNLDRFWDRADVRVDTKAPDSVRTRQAVRWNLFQLCQATWRAEGAGVPAKGLTGRAYEGHYFWDTEIYLLPFLAYTQPRIARNLLRFRHSMLPNARRRAVDLGHDGAMFPWRTINGDEASAYYQAGTAQYHINADIAYAIRRYVWARGDPGFLVEAGAEMLVETARLWADLGFYGDDGAFHIHGVTGPDEYTTVVNDNAYTNLMARSNLSYAAECVRWLASERPIDHIRLVEDTGLRPGEVEGWERAAAAMHVPYDERRGIHPQDSAFLDREPWDLDTTPAADFPLLLHYHPLEIYRRQVVKQADVVLAMFLLGDEFTDRQKRDNFEYYDRLTTGDSSLSASVESIVAAEVGANERALEYFRFALLMDLADAAGNASDGVHVACAGGVWQALVFGFGGVRETDGALAITPRLPAEWRSLEFPLRFCDRQLRVHLDHDEERYAIDEGEPLEIRVRGERHVVRVDRPLLLVAARTPDGA
jgi:alpha,alpha-trehalose phosphorylase